MLEQKDASRKSRRRVKASRSGPRCKKALLANMTTGTLHLSLHPSLSHSLPPPLFFFSSKEKSRDRKIVKSRKTGGICFVEGGKTRKGGRGRERVPLLGRIACTITTVAARRECCLPPTILLDVIGRLSSNGWRRERPSGGSGADGQREGCASGAGGGRGGGVGGRQWSGTGGDAGYRVGDDYS